MWKNRFCCLPCIDGSRFDEAPTTDDINYPPGYIAWTEDGEVYFHTGSGNWVQISGGGGGGGSGVDSINGQKGAITLTADAPLKITRSGKTFNITLEEKYIKTINKIAPTDDGDFTIDKKDPITVTDGTNKVTVGSTGGGGGGDGIKKIIIDDGELVPDADGAVTLKGDLTQGIQVIANDG